MREMHVRRWGGCSLHPCGIVEPIRLSLLMEPAAKPPSCRASAHATPTTIQLYRGERHGSYASRESGVTRGTTVVVSGLEGGGPRKEEWLRMKEVTRRRLPNFWQAGRVPCKCNGKAELVVGWWEGE